MVNKEIITPTELADEWRVSHPSILARIREGAFPNAFQVGAVWRIPRSDVEAYLEKQRKQHLTGE